MNFMVIEGLMSSHIKIEIPIVSYMVANCKITWLGIMSASMVTMAPNIP